MQMKVISAEEMEVVKSIFFVGKIYIIRLVCFVLFNYLYPSPESITPKGLF